MRILQNNIQSINTSLPLLKATVTKREIDVILLQEIWKPQEEIQIYNFQPPIIKTRDENDFGGVAILVSENCKMVNRKEFEVKGLEAVWAEIKVGGIQIIVGSVYSM